MTARFGASCDPHSRAKKTYDERAVCITLAINISGKRKSRATRVEHSENPVVNDTRFSEHMWHFSESACARRSLRWLRYTARTMACRAIKTQTQMLRKCHFITDMCLRGMCSIHQASAIRATVSFRVIPPSRLTLSITA